MNIHGINSVGTLNQVTGGYATLSGSFTGSFKGDGSQLTNLPTVTVNTGSLVTTASFNDYTQSNNQRVSSLETNSASVNISISALNTFTASQSTASIVTSIDNLNTFSASALVSISNLNTTTASLNTSVSNLNTATASLFNSASLALVTASFDTGSRNLTFTKGGNETFSVNIPDVSGSTNYVTTSSFNAYTASNDQKVDSLISATGSYATTGSNTFIGNQIIRATTGAPLVIDHLDASPTQNTLLGFLKSGSAVWDIGNSGTNDEFVVYNPDTFQTPLSIRQDNSVQILGALTASLAEGYTWVGNGSNVSTLVATSSFGSTINTGSFATTGSNSFVGDQTITGSLLISSSAFADLTITGAVALTGNLISSGSTGQVVIGNVAISITSNAQSSSATYGRNIMRQTSGSNAMGMAANPNQGGWVSGLTDPSILTYSGSQSSGNYYAPIRFQPGDQYTDGRVTFITPLSASAGFTASLQEGYAWVGNSLGQNTQVATSSFGTPTPAGTISGSAQITALGFVSSSVTASSLVTASVTNNTITFTKGDASTFQLTVDTGSGAGGAAFPYTGDAVITGSLLISGSNIPDLRVIGNIALTGSLSGQPITLSVASNTASIDMTAGNNFVLTLPSSSTTHIRATSILAGQTINLLVKQQVGPATGSITFAPTILFPSGLDMQATATGSAIDLVSMISFDTTNLMAANVKNLK